MFRQATPHSTLPLICAQASSSTCLLIEEVMVRQCVHRAVATGRHTWQLTHRSSSSVRIHRKFMTVQASASHAQRSVAVIGAGAAGLAAAKELRSEGHNVVVFEQGPSVGGVWIYDPATDSDTLGRNQSRRRVHSSMYKSLRTNLPREIMAFADLPFLPQAMNLVAAGARSQYVRQGRQVNTAPTLDCASVDARRFCSHEEVLRYLRAYAAFHDLTPLIHTSTKVLSVSGTQADTAAHIQSPRDAPPPAPFQWQVVTQQTNTQGSQQDTTQTWTFDAVVIANGHYSEPNLPDSIPGMDVCPVPQMHSHNYRTPEAYAGKVVLVVGASNSGEDISRELSGVASRVLLSAHSWKNDAWAADATPYGDNNNIYRQPLASELTADGKVVFPGGLVESIDAVIYCTGYQYVFPFLQDLHTPTSTTSQQGTAAQRETLKLGLDNKGRYLRPLYLHIFPPYTAPWIAFLGLPWKVVPFPQMQVQARLVARALSGRITLPPPEEQLSKVEQHFQLMAEAGVPDRYAHMQNLAQYEYNAELEQMSGPGEVTLKDWRQQVYIATGALKRAQPDNYRDMGWPESLGPVLKDMQQDLQQQLRDIESVMPDTGSVPEGKSLVEINT